MEKYLHVRIVTVKEEAMEALEDIKEALDCLSDKVQIQSD